MVEPRGAAASTSSGLLDDRRVHHDRRRRIGRELARGPSRDPRISAWVPLSVMVPQLPVRRIDFGYFVRPAGETGTGQPRVEPCLGYLIAHADGVVVVDTGMGSHPDVDAHYRPRRRPLAEALATAGVSLADVQYVVNCHLHFDHCGGNPQLAGRPIFTQRVELEQARGPDYTLPELVDAPGLSYEVLDGETEILRRVRRADPGAHCRPPVGRRAQ